MRSYAVGDIHGHSRLLAEAHARIRADRAATGDHAAPVVHLGDLVDRGPDSRGVIDFLMRGIAAGAPWLVLKGNHDRLFSLFLDDPWLRDPKLRPELSWLHPRIGGGPTLASYGVSNPADRPVLPVHSEALDKVPPEHRSFLSGLPTSYRRGDVLFAHAGIRPGVPLDDQAEDDLVWIRAPFLEDRRDHGALIVHGHTALDEPCHYGNRVNLDSSAGYGGPLTAVVIEGTDVWVLEKEGRRPLRPIG